jgi:hypothetical protein
VHKVYSAATLPDAHLVRALLAHAGIEARVFNENAQGGLGEIPFTHAWPEVWIVDAGAAARAREVIRQFEHQDGNLPAARCPRCEETSPGHFQVCWNCGESL